MQAPQLPKKKQSKLRAPPGDLLSRSALWGSDEVKNQFKLLTDCRETLIKTMKKSGSHESDPFTFSYNACRENSALGSVGEFALYYFCLKASEVPDFDSRFSKFMRPDLKGESSDPNSLSSKDKKKTRARLDVLKISSSQTTFV